MRVMYVLDDPAMLSEIFWSMVEMCSVLNPMHYPRDDATRSGVVIPFT